MAEANPFQSAGGSEGFFDHSRAILAALAEYLHARLRLTGIESKEALVHFAILAALAIGALVVVVFGYLFLCIGIAFLIADLLHMSKGWSVLVLALIHFGVAVVCLLIARARFAAPVFTHTIAEFKKDHQWLSHSNTPKQS